MDLSDTAEIITIVRDIAFLVLLLFLMILIFKVYTFVNSAKRTAKGAEEIVATVADKVVGRAVAGSGVAFGAGKVAAFLLGLRRNRRSGKGGNNDGEQQ